LNKVKEKENNSPAIITVVEAEEASFAHDSSKKFAEVIENRVENEGFNVIFKTVPQPENKNDNVIV